MIAERAKAENPNMGLTTWKGTKIRKSDVTVAKNYLTQDELSALNRIVTMYLDYADEQARQRKPMHMAEWIKKLDGFLAFNEKNILMNAGKVSAAMAEELAQIEFGKFEKQKLQFEAENPVSDFDKAVEDLKCLPRPKRKRKPGTDEKSAADS